MTTFSRSHAARNKSDAGGDDKSYMSQTLDLENFATTHRSSQCVSEGSRPPTLIFGGARISLKHGSRQRRAGKGDGEKETTLAQS